MLKILVYPRDATNPYQSLLYSPLAKRVRIRYLRSPTPLMVLRTVLQIGLICWYRLNQYSIFHVHWSYAFASQKGRVRSRASDIIVYFYYVLVLNAVKVLGYKIVWTAHNAMPHEPIFSGDRELRARRWLVRLADLVIVHSETTLEDLKRLGLIPKRSVIIPHGSYIGVYPNDITREEARKILGIKSGVFTYLFLGQIRDYKGVDTLIETYFRLHDDPSCLVLAGACRDQRLRNILAEGKGETLQWHDGLVQDCDMQTYFAAADVVVLPFKKVTTSGSALLALSFGKAVIVPKLGDLATLPETVSYKYDPTRADALKEAMLHARSNLEEVIRKGDAALEYAKKLEWPSIASATLREYEALIK